MGTRNLYMSPFEITVYRATRHTPLFLITPDSDADSFKRDIFAALSYCLLCHHNQTVAAGNFHVDNRKALNIALGDHCS